jgi:hypothetical protein
MVATIDPEYGYKKLYEELLEKHIDLQKKYSELESQYTGLQNLLDMLNSPEKQQNDIQYSFPLGNGNTPIENRKTQGKMNGQWTSYDKMENFDIFG